jgi:hypothetical protein
LAHLFQAFVQGPKEALVSGGPNLSLVIGHVRSVSLSHHTGRQLMTMIRVRIADSQDRYTLAKFLRFSDIVVHDDGVDTLVVDFANFDLDQQAQLRVVNKLLGVWQQTRDQQIDAEVGSDDEHSAKQLPVTERSEEDSADD